MIDIKELKTRYEEIKKNIQDRYMNVDLDKIIADQEKRAALLLEVEDLRAKRNENASKMKGKLDPETRQALIAEGKALKETLAGKEAEFNEIDAVFSQEARTIPNYVHPDAPVGKEDKDSLAIKFHLEPKKFPFKPKDHVQLGEELDILDFDSGAKVAGQKFYYIKNQLVILQMARRRSLQESASIQGEKNQTSIPLRVQEHVLSARPRSHWEVTTRTRFSTNQTCRSG